MGGQAGILEGERRWLPLALVYLGVGVGRLVFGLGFLATTETATGAMAGVALGAVVPVVIGSVALRHRSRDEQRERRGEVRGSSRRVIRELFHNSHALLAFFALSNNVGSQAWGVEFYRLVAGSLGPVGEDGLEADLFAGV